MNFLITICARGGSKGIPGKNIKEIAGQPLIGLSIDHALKFKDKHPSTDIYLSTDDSKIKKTVENLNADVHTDYSRPEKLATDAAGKIDAIDDVLKYAERENDTTYDIVLDLDVTSPLRNLQDLTEALKIIQGNTEAFNLFSVNPASRNPYFNMVEKQENGFYALSKKGNFVSRQTAPKVYELNASFYFYRRSFFAQNFKVAITEKSLIYEMPHICFDLDHPIDFDFLSFLIANKKLDFKFNL